MNGIGVLFPGVPIFCFGWDGHTSDLPVLTIRSSNLSAGCVASKIDGWPTMGATRYRRRRDRRTNARKRARVGVGAYMCYDSCSEAPSSHEELYIPHGKTDFFKSKKHKVSPIYNPMSCCRYPTNYSKNTHRIQAVIERCLDAKVHPLLQHVYRPIGSPTAAYGCMCPVLCGLRLTFDDNNVAFISCFQVGIISIARKILVETLEQ